MSFIWTGILVVCNILFGLTLFFHRRRRLGEPPLLNYAFPFVGEAFSFGANPYGYLKKAQERFGDVFTLKMAGWNYHFFMNPFDVVILEKCKDLDQTNVIGDFVTRMVGTQHSIHNNEFSLLSNGDPITNQAKHSKADRGETADKTQHHQGNNQNDVSHAIVRNLRGTTQLQELCRSCVMINVKCMTEKFNEVFKEGKLIKVGLHQLCKELIFSFTFNILFGFPPNEKERILETRYFYKEFSIFFKNSALLVDRIPIRLLPETKRSRDRLFEMIGQIDFSQRTNTSQMILDVLKTNPKKSMQVRHLLILLWSAQANTIPALFWMLFYVFKDPNVQNKILEEYHHMLAAKKESFGQSNENTKESILEECLRLDKGDLDKLVVLDSVLKEVMRITGSNLNIRKALKDTTVHTFDGKTYCIRKGDYTSHYVPFTHYDGDIFDRPKNFLYDRFLECEKSDSNFIPNNTTKHAIIKPRSRFFKNDHRINASRAVLTFGFGVTRCPGRHLAMMEIKILTISFLKYFNNKLESHETPGYDLRNIGFGVMPPNHDINVNISQKSNV